MIESYEDLEPDQQKAYDLAANPKQGITRIIGYAGTGKTTVMALVAKTLGKDCEVLAPTNKATLNLRKKGIKKARTIHNCLYMPHEVEIYKEDKGGNIIYQMENGEFLLDDDGMRIPEILEKRLNFGLKEKSENEFLPPIVLVDEASMVDETILNDLQEFFPHIVLFGDDFQLPPVGKDKKSSLDLGEADIRLTEVHRVAKDNPIIGYATNIRNDEEPDIKDVAEKGSAICSCSRNHPKLYEIIVNHDMQTICWRNKTRHLANEKIRAVKGYSPNTLVEGEKVICNSNVYEWISNSDGERIKRLKFYNGQVLSVVGDYEQTSDNFSATIIRLEDDNGKVHVQRVWPFWNKGFFDVKDNKDIWYNEIQRRKSSGATKVVFGYDFDYAYCLTVHKAQGSEFPIVCIIDERPTLQRVNKKEKQRWYYTAITRSQKRTLIAK